ncbi:T9SS type A sorting domain-containing protein [Parasegetibacter sp. NRK P23]|uniref:T9SS type A sorting domain-containing protein n=1 Tax=Parasegetibacter sp. NRK P23 TaxID=2942999 RepID=UPI0020448CA0|nr:T9SS type A sorting domain-containing protein [Parasegetibacter sp. NRK P23]MCM5530450.1 T9SS type A sorting domain-containing protein [Parasegetibacter sp. NRK P23]
MAQSPGQIIRPVGGAGVTVLNPNGDAYSSATVTGFTTSDITQSEIAFKVVPPAVVEPTGDVATGPNGGFTDIVKTFDGSGFYIYTDGTNLMFRLRIGNVISGSKGYSILVDTDGKIGNTGPYADPNYVAGTNTSSGNPGFEYEVVLETNFRVAVYHVDGSASPGAPVATYPLNTHSQISRALTTDGNTPDYFYDWYVPLTAIGNPASFRLVATTVTSPSSALQGSRSDIYGIDDAANANVSAAWQSVTNAQPTITVSGFNGVSAVCTAAPVLSSPIATGSNISVTGTWSRMDATKPGSATITLYKNGSSVGTTAVNSGNTWSISVSSIANGDVFYARAQASGETQCLQSNNVTASGCITPPASPVLSCGSLKGISGTMPSTASGNTVAVYLVPTTSSSPTSNMVSNGTNLTYPSTTSFAYYTNGCSGGTNYVATGVYMIVTNNGSCSSSPVFVCINSGSSGTPSPLATNALSITQPVYASHTSISGTGAATGDVLRLFINGQYKQSITTTGTGFTFSGLALQTGDQLKLYSQTGSSCMTQSATFTVSCFSQPPSITTNATGNLLHGATTISGTSAYPGASVQVYKGTSPSGTATGSAVTVNSSGAWSVSVPAMTNGETYYAQQTISGCTSSASSPATVLTPASCPTITGSYTGSSTSVSGTMPSSFTGIIRLYQDGAQIGSVSISGSSWNITLSANTLYYNGVLHATAQASGGAESNGCGTVTVGCSAPATPSITPGSAIITEGQDLLLNISNVSSNNWYALMDNTGASFATSMYTTTSSNFSLTSNTFTTAGTYNLYLSADALTGCPNSSTPLTVTVNSATLPVKFVSVAAKRNGESAVISWKVAEEQQVAHYEVQQSTDCNRFETIGTVAFNAGLNGNYQFTPSSLPEAEKVCFRIKQVDKSGTFMYSAVFPLNNADVLRWQVTPNPVQTVAKLSVSVPAHKTGTIYVMDMHGKTMFSRKCTFTKGQSNIALPEVGQLAQGTYLVCLSIENTVEFRKIIKQ